MQHDPAVDVNVADGASDHATNQDSGGRIFARRRNIGIQNAAVEKAEQANRKEVPRDGQIADDVIVAAQFPVNGLALLPIGMKLGIEAQIDISPQAINPGAIVPHCLQLRGGEDLRAGGVGGLWHAAKASCQYRTSKESHRHEVPSLSSRQHAEQGRAREGRSEELIQKPAGPIQHRIVVEGS